MNLLLLARCAVQERPFHGQWLVLQDIGTATFYGHDIHEHFVCCVLEWEEFEVNKKADKQWETFTHPI